MLVLVTFQTGQHLFRYPENQHRFADFKTDTIYGKSSLCLWIHYTSHLFRRRDVMGWLEELFYADRNGSDIYYMRFSGCLTRYLTISCCDVLFWGRI